MSYTSERPSHFVLIANETNPTDTKITTDTINAVYEVLLLLLLLTIRVIFEVMFEVMFEVIFEDIFIIIIYNIIL